MWRGGDLFAACFPQAFASENGIKCKIFSCTNKRFSALVLKGNVLSRTLHWRTKFFLNIGIELIYLFLCNLFARLII